jgi:hypothetical protein
MPQLDVRRKLLIPEESGKIGKLIPVILPGATVKTSRRIVPLQPDSRRMDRNVSAIAGSINLRWPQARRRDRHGSIWQNVSMTGALQT